MKRRIFPSLLLLLLCACRSIILEDRLECPSFLYFDIVNGNKVAGYEKLYTSLFAHPDGRLMDGTTTSVKTVRDREFYFVVRKTEAVKGYGVLGYSQCYSEKGSEWVVPLGQQFDSLFRFSFQAEVEPESFLVPVELVKEHCKVSLQFVGMEDYITPDGRFPFEVIVRGNSCGLDVMTGVPVRGAFEYRPTESSSGRFDFILCRQADESLMLELNSREWVADLGSGVLDLWRILHDSGGVSWNEKNLPDVQIVIDYVRTEVKVKVVSWESQSLIYEF